MPKRKFINRNELKKDEEGQALIKYYTIDEIKSLHGGDDEKRILSFVISTGGIDRDNDTINVAGWEVSNFMKNPVVLFGHNSRELPIARASNLSFESDKFKSDAEFMHPDLSKFSDTVFRMLKGKFLNAVSVGFDPLEFVFNEERGGFGVDFKKQELLEYSVVPVPSNPEALQIARSQGIDTQPIMEWAEKILDQAEVKFWMPKRVLEEMRKHADSTGAVHIFIQHKDKNEGVVLDLNGSLIYKKIELPKILTKDELETLKISAAWVDPDKENLIEGYKLLHHDTDSLEGKANFRDVAACMKILLGATREVGEQILNCKEAYNHLVEHYKEFEKEAPDFKYIEAQVLKTMPDDFIFDDETGSVVYRLIDLPIDETEDDFDAKDIADMTTTAITQALNEHLGKLD